MKKQKKKQCEEYEQHEKYNKNKAVTKIADEQEKKQGYDAMVEENAVESVISKEDFEDAFPPFEPNAIPETLKQHPQQPITMIEACNFDREVDEKIISIEEPVTIPTTSYSSELSELSAKKEWNWDQIVPQLKLEGMTGQFVNHCLLDKIEGNTVFLLLDKGAEDLYNSKMEQELKASLEIFLEKPITISLKTAQVSNETPAYKAERQLEVDQMDIEKMIMDDPFVQALQSKLGAEILPRSIKHRKE